MANDSSKPGDHSSDAPKQRSEKASENLAKASPELNASNLRSAQKANPNRTDTVSPDGKSRFSLTNDSKSNDKQAKALQEKAYRDAGLGDPHKPIGKSNESAIDHQKITEQAAKALSKIMDAGKSAMYEGAKVWQGAHNGMHELVDDSVSTNLDMLSMLIAGNSVTGYRMIKDSLRYLPKNSTKCLAKCKIY